MTDATKWAADPKRGEAFVAPRRDELIEEMHTAADVAMAAIDANYQEALRRLAEEAGNKRAKVRRTVTDMEEMEPMRLVRKFWHADRAVMWQHFLGDQTSVGGIS